MLGSPWECVVERDVRMDLAPEQGPLAGIGTPLHATAELARAAEVRRSLEQLARQHPLLETRPSLAAVGESRGRAPRSVFAGVGLVCDGGLSRGVPFDVLGLLLSAESVRRAAGCDELIVLLADAHAVCHGLPESVVAQGAARYRHVLGRIAERCGLSRMRVLSASELHREPSYLRELRNVESRAPAGADPYVTREVADIRHFAAQRGALIKVGWALQPSRLGADRDERMFDEAFERWVGSGAWFVYTKAGRPLDDRRRKAPPYAESDPARRICLHGGEDAATKLTLARQRLSPSTFRGVQRHLNAITRSYTKLVRPLEGSLESRVQAVIDDVLGDGPTPARRATPRAVGS